MSRATHNKDFVPLVIFLGGTETPAFPVFGFSKLFEMAEGIKIPTWDFA